MTVSLKHAFTSAEADGADADLVQPSNWNAEHDITCATDKLLGRATAGTGAVEEITCTSFARTLLDDADAAAARTTLGLGTAATVDTGTSGATIPILNAANTFASAQTFSAGVVVNEATARAFELRTRTGVSTLPAVFFRPTQSNTTIAFDVIPKGTVSNNGEGMVAWADICDRDIGDSGSDVTGMRIGTGTDFGYLGTFKYGAGSTNPFKWHVGLTIKGRFTTTGISSGSDTAPAGMFDATDGTVHNLVHTDGTYGVFGTSSNHDVRFWANGAARLQLYGSNGTITPVTDNVSANGFSSNRWTAIYATNGTIQTSDAREKDIEGLIDDRALDAVASLNLYAWRWKTGPDSKRHVGPTAQDLEAAFAERGLNAEDWGVFDRCATTDRLSINYAELMVLRMAAMERKFA